MSYWQHDIECISRDALKELQLEKLRKTVSKVYESVPFYRKY